MISLKKMIFRSVESTKIVIMNELRFGRTNCDVSIFNSEFPIFSVNSDAGKVVLRAQPMTIFFENLLCRNSAGKASCLIA